MVSRMPDDICSAPDVASASSCMSSSVRFPKLSCMWYMQMLHTGFTVVSKGVCMWTRAMNVVMSSTFSLSAVSVSLRQPELHVVTCGHMWMEMQQMGTLRCMTVYQAQTAQSLE